MFNSIHPKAGFEEALLEVWVGWVVQKGVHRCTLHIIAWTHALPLV